MDTVLQVSLLLRAEQRGTENSFDLDLPWSAHQAPFVGKLSPVFLENCFGCSEEFAVVGSMLPTPEQGRNDQKDAHRASAIVG